MKRDQDLVRALVLKLEALPVQSGSLVSFHPEDDEIAVEGYTSEQIAYHLELIYEAGWVDYADSRNGRMMDGSFLFRRLTGPGHDFVDAVRDPAIWKKTKAGASAAGGWTVGILKDLAIGYAKQEIQKHTGIQL